MPGREGRGGRGFPQQSRLLPCVAHAHWVPMPLPSCEHSRPAAPLTTDASVWLPIGTALSTCPLPARLSSWDPTSGPRTPVTGSAKPVPRGQPSQPGPPACRLHRPLLEGLGPPLPVLPAPGRSARPEQGRRLMGAPRTVGVCSLSPTLPASSDSGAGCRAPYLTLKKKKEFSKVAASGCLLPPPRAPVCPPNGRSW